MKQALLLIPAMLLGLTASGCYAHSAYVRVPPPPLRAEVYGYAPGPGYVWVNGFWRWGGRRYVWAPGYWARPPRRHSQWVPGRWESSPRGYYWQRGRWR
jgi:hypothetical protein